MKQVDDATSIIGINETNLSAAVTNDQHVVESSTPPLGSTIKIRCSVLGKRLRCEDRGDSFEKEELPEDLISSSAKVYRIRKGRWRRSEHVRFLKALLHCGKDWRAVHYVVKTRTSTQARSHAQKFLSKIRRKGVSLKEFLDKIDFKNQEKLSA